MNQKIKVFKQCLKVDWNWNDIAYKKIVIQKSNMLWVEQCAKIIKVQVPHTIGAFNQITKRNKS